MNAMEGIQGVFLVAGVLTTPLAADIWMGVNVNVKGLQNVLDAARWRGAGKVVFSSSVGVYAGTSADEYRSEEHTSELQSLMRISYAVFCLKKKTTLQN